jgi:hypothetical protein
MFCLRDVLLNSVDSNSPVFLESQQVLSTQMSDNPSSFTLDLLDQLADPECPRQVLFLSLVLIHHCFTASVTPISVDHKYLESTFPIALDVRCLDTAFSLFTSVDPAIRNQASDLFGTIAMARSDEEVQLTIFPRLIELLHARPSFEATQSAIECIQKLIVLHPLPDSAKIEVVQTIFEILSLEGVSVDLAKTCIGFLCDLKSVDFDFRQLLSCVIQFLGSSDFRITIYNFLSASIEGHDEIIPLFEGDMFGTMMEDLDPNRPRELIIALTSNMPGLLSSVIHRSCLADGAHVFRID